jgi:hypothetical protein
MSYTCQVSQEKDNMLFKNVMPEEVSVTFLRSHWHIMLCKANSTTLKTKFAHVFFC